MVNTINSNIWTIRFLGCVELYPRQDLGNHSHMGGLGDGMSDNGEGEDLPLSIGAPAMW